MIEYDIKRLSSKNKWLLNHLCPVIYSKKRVRSEDIDINISEVVDEFFLYKKDSFDCTDRVILEGYDIFYDEKVRNKLISLSLIKSTEWEYEHEWRLSVPVIELEQEKKIFYGIVSFDCIKAIYCGPRMETSVKQHIKEIVCRINSNCKFNIELFYMRRDGTEYQLTEYTI